MKVTIISNFDLESGRGPVFRLMNILSILNSDIELSVISLQDPDELSRSMFEKNNISYRVVHYNTDGWFVVDSDLVARKIQGMLFENDAELCVLGWEYWDIAVSLSDILKGGNCKFAIVFHSIPFVDALPFPSIYQQDLLERISHEKNDMIRRYLLKRSENVEKILSGWNIISINQTVSFYLDTYFPELRYFKAYPGYALNTKNILDARESEKEYDFVFMSKLENSKGIFDLIEVVAEIKKKRPDIRIRIIGDFLYDNEEKQIMKLIDSYGINQMISFSGWLSESAKYEELKKGKVFLYPSLTGDTFSFCLLEALTCGLNAVCYDTPFARIIYSGAPVRRVEYRNIELFAEIALKLLDETTEETVRRAVQFVENNYSDWEKVAKAEERVYEQILRM